MSKTYFKKSLQRKKVVLYNMLIKPLYRVDVLLWRLGFFPSIRSAQQQLKKKGFYLNKAKLSFNSFLKRGDILKLDSPFFNKDIFFKNNFFLSFCEIDYYTGTIVILKNYNQLLNKDFALIFRNNIDLRSFIYYLKRN